MKRSPNPDKEVLHKYITIFHKNNIVEQSTELTAIITRICSPIRGILTVLPNGMPILTDAVKYSNFRNNLVRAANALNKTESMLFILPAMTDVYVVIHNYRINPLWYPVAFYGVFELTHLRVGSIDDIVRMVNEYAELVLQEINKTSTKPSLQAIANLFVHIENYNRFIKNKNNWEILKKKIHKDALHKIVRRRSIHITKMLLDLLSKYVHSGKMKESRVEAQNLIAAVIQNDIISLAELVIAGVIDSEGKLFY